MDFSSTVAGASRSAQIKKLLDAIDQAQHLAWRLGMVEGQSRKAIGLYIRLETLRLEVESIRSGRSAGRHPWTPSPNAPLI